MSVLRRLATAVADRPPPPLAVGVTRGGVCALVGDTLGMASGAEATELALPIDASVCTRELMREVTWAGLLERLEAVLIDEGA